MKVDQISRLEELAQLVGEFSFAAQKLNEKWQQNFEEEVLEVMDETYTIQTSFDDLAIDMRKWKEDLDAAIVGEKINCEARDKEQVGVEARVLVDAMEEMIMSFKIKHNLC